MSTGKLFTRAEAAAYLGISLRTLDRWREYGWVTDYRMAGPRRLLRFDSAELTELKEPEVTEE